MKSNKISSDATLLSGYLEKNYFQHCDIEGRYVIYNGTPIVKDYEIGTIIFTPPTGNILDHYFEFEKNMEAIPDRLTIGFGNQNISQSRGPGITRNEASHYAEMVRDKLTELKECVEETISRENLQAETPCEPETKEHSHNFHDRGMSL